MMKTAEINGKERVVIETSPKSGLWYVVLAWFVGVLGIHNFYAGYFIRGLVQLILTAISWMFGFIPLLVVIAWVFLDMLFVSRDAQGVPFKGDTGVITVVKIIAAFWLLGNMYYLYSSGVVIIDSAEILPSGQEVSVEMTE